MSKGGNPLREALRDQFDDIPLGGGKSTTKRTRTKPVGRIDRSGQEAVIELDQLKDRLQTLVDLYVMQQDAGKDLNEGIKAVAEASGLHAAVVRKVVVAKASDRFADKHREVKQLALAFEAVE